jgi:hypothetical protein
MNDFSNSDSATSAEATLAKPALVWADLKKWSKKFRRVGVDQTRKIKKRSKLRAFLPLRREPLANPL